MLVRPSLVLQVKLMPEDYSEQAAAEIKRSYIYQAQSLVSELSEEERADGNIMRLSIRLMRPYWSTSDPKAQELWEGVMPQWLRNAANNISTIMHNYNTVDHPEGSGNITYSWADFEFGRHALLRVKVDEENRITKELPAIAEKARRLINEGVFGEEEIALIRIPSAANYERQLQTALEGERSRLEAEALREREEECASNDAEAVDGLDVAVDTEIILEEETSVAPAFDIDFSVWGIEYANGEVMEFDSAQA